MLKTKWSLYTSAKASVLGAAWSLLPSCADDLVLLGTSSLLGAVDPDVAWNLPPSFGRPLDAAWNLLLPFLYPSYCAEEACDISTSLDP